MLSTTSLSSDTADTALQRQDLAALLDVAKALARESDLDTLLELITDKATEVTGADRSTLFLYDAASCELWSKIAQKLGSGEIRFPLGVGIAGTVAETLCSEIIIDPYQDPRFNTAFDQETGYQTRSILCAPVIGSDGQLLGVIQVLNKHGKILFDGRDKSLLEAFASHAAVALERGKTQEMLAQAHNELQSLYNAKTKMINHLSHELKTPLSIISASCRLLHNKTIRADPDRSQRTLQRIDRNLQRLLELESEARDITQSETSRQTLFLRHLIQQAADLLANIGEGESDRDEQSIRSIALSLSRRIDEFFQTEEECQTSRILLAAWLPRTLAAIEPLYQHRRIDVRLGIGPVPPIQIPESPLRKAFTGLVRNAIENTADGGRIAIELGERNGTVCLQVRDFELGMSKAFQQQLFHGFVHSEDTADYASRKPYEFKAGGRGLDLLRTRIFAERYGFDIQVTSQLGKGSCFTLAFPPATCDPNHG